MNKKRIGRTIFVCSSICEEKLISKIVSASSYEEAETIFLEKYLVKAQEILGPFSFRNIKKNILEEENNNVLKFLDNKPHKAYYNDWLVNAFLLSQPIDYAYLIFIKRNDEKKIPAPKGTITVPIYDLRFIKDE